MIVQNSLLLIFIAFLVVARGISGDDDEVIWGAFRDSLRDPNDINSTVSLELAASLEEPRFFQLPIYGKPLLHQILNMYWLNKNPKTKEGLVELLLLCIRKGADPDSNVNGEPNAISKSVLIRELRLSTALISNSVTPIHQDSSKLWDLYSLSCNPTPLTKLLLHANTLSSRKYISQLKQSTALDIAAKFVETHFHVLLSSARLDGQGPTIKMQDLNQTSDHFVKTISKLSHNIAENKRIYGEVSLFDVVESVGDAVSKVHQAVLGQAGVSALSVAVVLNTTVSQGRNPLHMLAAAGSTAIIDQLASFFRSHLTPNSFDKLEDSNYNRDVIRILRGALHHRDARGVSPLLFAQQRYGSKSRQYHAMKQLLSVINDDNEVMVDADALLVTDVDIGVNGLSSDPGLKSRSAVDRYSRTIVEHIHNDTGNWNTVSLDETLVGDTHRCDIEEVWDGLPSSHEFVSNYINQGKPVIFRGAAHGMQIRQAFTKDDFIGRYGNQITSSSVIPYANSFGFGASPVTLAEVANSTEISFKTKSVDLPVASSSDSSDLDAIEAPSYVFTVSSRQFQRLLYEDAPAPPILNSIPGTLTDGSIALQFYLGAAGTGAPAHFHGHAVNTLAYGQKKWYLFAPGDAFYSTQPALEFATRDLRANPQTQEESMGDGVRAMQCTQRGGDIMFVPTLWGHATLNVQQSIGVAHEFTVESFCME